MKRIKSRQNLLANRDKRINDFDSKKDCLFWGNNALSEYLNDKMRKNNHLDIVSNILHSSLRNHYNPLIPLQKTR